MESSTEILAARPRLAQLGVAAGFAAIFVLVLIVVSALSAGVAPGLPEYLIGAGVFGILGFLVARLAVDRERAAISSTRHFELSREMICIVRLDGTLESVNPAFERNLGYREEELLDHPVAEFVHPDDRERTAAEVAAIPLGDGSFHFQNRWFDKQGEVHWLEWSSAVFPAEGLIYAVARDVTDRRRLELELEQISQRDPLTGVYNRRRFDEELDATLTEARRYKRGGALLLIDLDRFKRINDELGHEIGDMALREVARVLDENTRGSDAVGRAADGLVARVSGDEFAVLLAEAGPVEAAAVGKRLVAALDAIDLRVEGSAVPLAISVGVAPFDGRDPLAAEELLALADQAMCVVKAGRDDDADEPGRAGSGVGTEPA
jgi:diguanylate cyclase (GGDEF)-like protein/PAS domain S-box-containing protein